METQNNGGRSFKGLDEAYASGEIWSNAPMFLAPPPTPASRTLETPADIACETQSPTSQFCKREALAEIRDGIISQNVLERIVELKRLERELRELKDEVRSALKDGASVVPGPLDAYLLEPEQGWLSWASITEYLKLSGEQVKAMRATCPKTLWLMIRPQK